jgi:C-terminal processing protease CtpA/Prc
VCGVLTHFRSMFIDIQQEKIFLEPNRLYQEAFEVNCSGLELVMDETFQKVIVDYVYTASPAEESGLRVGDEIVQIETETNHLLERLTSAPPDRLRRGYATALCKVSC